jgi:hypothetical protein
MFAYGGHRQVATAELVGKPAKYSKLKRRRGNPPLSEMSIQLLTVQK